MPAEHGAMRTTLLPPHIAAQTFASQPLARPQPAAPAGAPAPDGFEALALKSANPGRVIAPRPPEPKPAAAAPAPATRTAADTAPAATMAAPAAAASSPAPAPAPERLLRPGSRLDIRV
jgi:hypothetical protein